VQKSFWSGFCQYQLKQTTMNSKKLLFASLLVLLTLPVFSQQLDLSLIPYRQGNLWGYASPDRTIVIKPAYDEANWFVSGYAVVKKGNKYGYINRAGKLVIPFKFYAAKPFRYGYFDNAGKHMVGGKTVKTRTVSYLRVRLQNLMGLKCASTQRVSACRNARPSMKTPCRIITRLL